MTKKTTKTTNGKTTRMKKAETATAIGTNRSHQHFIPN
ncbi:MAG: hypothetical protein QT00_C0001G0513 [archaeon GW2011_AR5]|nr:MAG: hypothetical protein QT00_C0001G0513 [archaeon GW2011_AR5]